MLLVTACGTDEDGDTNAAADDSGFCAEADVGQVTWDNFGRGFVTERCQTCHASESLDRQGAPESVVFDTEEDVWGLASAMLDAATGDAPRMPPQGGVDEEDRFLLEVWLRCGG